MRWWWRGCVYVWTSYWLVSTISVMLRWSNLILCIRIHITWYRNPIFSSDVKGHLRLTEVEVWKPYKLDYSISEAWMKLILLQSTRSILFSGEVNGQQRLKFEKYITGFDPKSQTSPWLHLIQYTNYLCSFH